MGIRLIILFAIVGVLALVALFRPKIGLFGYIWFAVLRPDFLAWAPHEYPLSFILAVATLIGVAIHVPGRVVYVFSSPITRLILLLQAPVMLSCVLAVNPALTWMPLSLYWRMLVMALIVVMLVETKKDLMVLAIVIGGSLGALAAKMGLAGLLAGGVQYAAGYGGMLSDNNTYALALAMGVPICWYLKDAVKPVWMKAGFVMIAILSVPGVLMTYSRGATISLGVGVMLIAVRSKQKAAVGLLTLVMAMGLLAFLGPSFSERLATVSNPTEEASANARIIMAKAGLKLAADYPLFGVGFGGLNQQMVIGRYISPDVSIEKLFIHNTYLQMLADSGIFAMILYIALLATALWMLQMSYWRVKKYPEFAPYPLMLQTSLIVFSIDALVLSRVSFDITYILLAMSAAWLRLEPFYLRSEAPAMGPARNVEPAVVPLSEAPAPAPLSQRQPDTPLSAREPIAPLSQRQPDVGIASRRAAELRQDKDTPGLASS